MKILVTGATGFIGSHLVKLLLKEEHTVFCTLLENEIEPCGEENINYIIISHNFRTDIANYLSQNNIDGIIHLASFVQSGEHKSSEIEVLLNANIQFGTILLEAATIENVKWFINTGTYWQHYNNEDYSPVNLYAATKQAFMDIAKYYWSTNKIKFCTIMLYDTYGPNDPRPKIFNLWKQFSVSGKTLEMSSGEQIIDISHVEDIVAAFYLLSKHLQNNHPEIKNGNVFSLKAENRYSLKELSTIYEQTTGYKLDINWGSRPYKIREVMIPWKNETIIPDWIPKISVKDGIKTLFK